MFAFVFLSLKIRRSCHLIDLQRRFVEPVLLICETACPYLYSLLLAISLTSWPNVCSLFWQSITPSAGQNTALADLINSLVN